MDDCGIPKADPKPERPCFMCRVRRGQFTVPTDKTLDSRCCENAFPGYAAGLFEYHDHHGPAALSSSSKPRTSCTRLCGRCLSRLTVKVHEKTSPQTSRSEALQGSAYCQCRVSDQIHWHIPYVAPFSAQSCICVKNPVNNSSLLSAT